MFVCLFVRPTVLQRHLPLLIPMVFSIDGHRKGVEASVFVLLLLLCFYCTHQSLLRREHVRRSDLVQRRVYFRCSLREVTLNVSLLERSEKTVVVDDDDDDDDDDLA